MHAAKRCTSHCLRSNADHFAEPIDRFFDQDDDWQVPLSDIDMLGLVAFLFSFLKALFLQTDPGFDRVAKDVYQGSSLGLCYSKSRRQVFLILITHALVHPKELIGLIDSRHSLEQSSACLDQLLRHVAEAVIVDMDEHLNCVDIKTRAIFNCLRLKDRSKRLWQASLALDSPKIVF